MRSETAEAVTRSQRPSGGCRCPPSQCLRGTEPGAVLTTTSDGSPTPRRRRPGGRWWGVRTRGRDLWGVGTPGVFFCPWV